MDELPLVVRWLRANLLASGVQVERMTIHEAYDVLHVLGPTMRAVGFDDWLKSIRGSKGKTVKLGRRQPSPSAMEENSNAARSLAQLIPESSVPPAVRKKLLGG